MKTFTWLFWFCVPLCGQWIGQAQIAIGLGGIAPIAFNSSPALPASEWASSLTGVGVDSLTYVSAADVAAAVQTLNQNSVTGALARISANNLSEDARHNTTGGYLITQSSSVGATLLKATLRNNSGQPISHITVGYNFGVVVTPGIETAPGHRAFFSTNGQANSWQPIPQFSGLSSAAYVSAALFVGNWMPNTDIHLLWADDNTDENPDGGYTIDNFSVSNVVVATPPGNDTCAAPIPLFDGVTYSMNTANATSSGDPGTACGTSVGKGVWFTYRHNVPGTVFVTTTADYLVRVEVYNPGGFSPPCNLAGSIGCDSFTGDGFRPYTIFVGGVSNAGGNLTIQAAVCTFSRFTNAGVIASVPEPGGIRVFYQAAISGSPPGRYDWSFDGSFFTNTFTTNGSADVISRFYGPFDPYPSSLFVQYFNRCNGASGSGNPVPPCNAICLSVGAPATRSGTDGAGANGFSYSSGCGSFPAAGTKWFRMTTLTNATGLATVSTEGSTYDTVLGVYRGNVSSPDTLQFVACNNDIDATNKRSRVQFETRTNMNYWLAVNSPTVGTLNLTYDYEVKITNLIYNKTTRTVNLRSAPLASLPYRYNLLSATNLTSNPASWSVFLTTNFSAANSASNNFLQYFHTNPAAITRRFYRIQPFLQP